MLAGVFCLCSAVADISAATLIVDQNLAHTAPAGETIYRTAQAAHDAAAPGDTLIFMGAINSYGDLNISKPLKIYGPGFDIVHNYPDKNTNRLDARLRHVTFNNGSVDYDADGTQFIGMYIEGSVGLQSTNGTEVHNIVFKNCRITTVGIPASGTPQMNSWVFRKCWITGHIYNGTSCHNWLISNSLISSHCDLINSVIDHCTMRESSIGHSYNNCIINRSILLARTITSTDSSLNNCLYNGSEITLPAGNVDVNSFGVSYDSLFEGGSQYTRDHHHQLVSLNFLNGTALANVHPGAFGGAAPYRLSGLPDIPVIMRVEGPQTIIQGESLVLRIDVSQGE